MALVKEWQTLPSSNWLVISNGRILACNTNELWRLPLLSASRGDWVKRLTFGWLPWVCLPCCCLLLTENIGQTSRAQNCVNTFFIPFYTFYTFIMLSINTNDCNSIHPEWADSVWQTIVLNHYYKVNNLGECVLTLYIYTSQQSTKKKSYVTLCLSDCWMLDMLVTSAHWAVIIEVSHYPFLIVMTNNLLMFNTNRKADWCNI